MAAIGTAAAAKITARATAAGITADELHAMVTFRRHRQLEDVSRKDAAGITGDIEAREAQNRRGLATDAQVSYIVDLLAQGRGEYPSWMSGPTDVAAVRRLTRTAASQYIDSLKGAF